MAKARLHVTGIDKAFELDDDESIDDVIRTITDKKTAWIRIGKVLVPTLAISQIAFDDEPTAVSYCSRDQVCQFITGPAVN